MMGTSKFQELENAVEPYLAVQVLGPVPISLVIGCIGAVVTLLLLDSRRFPAGLVVVAGGVAAGLVLGARPNMCPGDIGLNLPTWLQAGFPAKIDFTFALFALVIPQLPMTLGNAVLAYTDLSRQFFKEASAKVTNRKACVSMALANLLSFCVGGMPMCHGAGGLAAHFRFGARTAGSNVIIGVVFAAMALLLGRHIIDVLHLLPMSILGVMLVFAGA
jgi:sulfate permease, SulP family